MSAVANFVEQHLFARWRAIVAVKDNLILYLRQLCSLLVHTLVCSSNIALLMPSLDNLRVELVPLLVIPYSLCAAIYRVFDKQNFALEIMIYIIFGFRSYIAYADDEQHKPQHFFS